MNIIIDGIELPTCDKDGFTLSEQIEFSENAGTSASGLWSGDIKAIKKVATITWSNLTSEKATLIFNAISSKLFYQFQATDPLDPSKNISFTARKVQGLNYTAKIKLFDKYRLEPITITIQER